MVQGGEGCNSRLRNPPSHVGPRRPSDRQGRRLRFARPTGQLELFKPLREAIKLFSGELGNGGLKFFNTHKLLYYRLKSPDGNTRRR